MHVRSVLALAAVCLASVAAQAATFYPTTGSIAVEETSLNVTPSSSGSNLWTTAVMAQNTGTTTLNQVYLFTLDPVVNGTALTLTSFGDYTGPNGLYADADNAAVFITRAQTDQTVDRRSAGNSTLAEIPGFLIAETLAPGQTASFDVDFTLPASAGSFDFDEFTTASAVTPEPSSLLLLGTGLLGTVGILRKRLA